MGNASWNELERWGQPLDKRDQACKGSEKQSERDDFSAEPLQIILSSWGWLENHNNDLMLHQRNLTLNTLIIST